MIKFAMGFKSELINKGFHFMECIGLIEVLLAPSWRILETRFLINIKSTIAA